LIGPSIWNETIQTNKVIVYIHDKVINQNNVYGTKSIYIMDNTTSSMHAYILHLITFVQ